MLTLCGFSASNYYNKVKLALLEKGLPFTEELAWWARPTAAPARWARCPTCVRRRDRCVSLP